MSQLLEQFADLVLNINFLWIVIAVTITMEVLKWTVPYLKRSDSKWYPLWVLLICVLWTVLKAVIVAESTTEWIGNFIFTILLADFIYTYIGQYIIMAVVSIFKIRVNVKSPPTDASTTLSTGPEVKL